jgi:ubiquitin-protein ligase
MDRARLVKCHCSLMQELFSIKSDPASKVQVLKFGFKPGSPVRAEFLVEGTAGTSYAGAFFPLEITFQVQCVKAALIVP